MRKHLLLILIYFGISSSALSQFTTTGSASAMAGCNQFEITPNSNTQTGSMHSLVPVDLTTNFSLLFKVKFGCDEFGGEGMAFMFQPGVWTLGTGDYNLGYGGLTNTLAVEFDTRDNQSSGQTTNFDIAGDHISLMSNGNINHNAPTCLTGLPLDPISTLTGDVEDCVEHLVEIIWTPGATQTITVNVDGATSLTHTSDMINNDLGGATLVTWGWTGATGLFSNQQTVEIALCPFFDWSPTNCPGQVITFNDLSISQNPIIQYDWDFDGTIVNNGGPNPTHTFATAGNHPVTLTVTDNQGCTADTTIDVGVGFQANISADDLTVCAGGSTILHAEGIPFSGNTCCFELHCHDIWSDGWGGTDVEVFVDGVSQGTYFPPNLGGGGAHTEVFPMCFTHGAVVDLVINGTPGIQPQESSVYLINATNDTVARIESNFISGGLTWVDGGSDSYLVDCGITPPAYTYQWDNPGLLNNSTLADPTCTIPSSTTFTVDITDPNTGCVISNSITINTFAVPDAVISGNETVCQGTNADLTINFTGTGPYDLTINGPTGPINLTGISANPYTLSVPDDGNYTITSFTGNGCTGTFSGNGTVTVIIPPVVDIEMNATYCDGDAIAALNVISSNGGTVNWYDNPGLNPPILATGNSYTPNPPIGTTTYYAAETEAVLGCVGPTDQVTITVNPVPTAPVVTGNTTYCEGDLASPLVATATQGGNMTWYDAAPPATVLSTNISYAPPLPVGTFDIYVTETAAGCESPATQVTITVNPTPLPPAVNGQLNYCEGEIPTDLTATPTMAGTITWENTSNTILGTGTNYTPTLVVGTSTIWVYEELNGCKSDSTEVIMNVDAAPTVDVPTQHVICKGDSVSISAANNGYAITWSNGDSGTPIFLGPDTTTMYFVTATNPSCGTATDSITIIVNDKPNLDAGTDTLIGLGGEVTLWASSTQNVTYEWIPEPDECVETDCSLIYDVPDQATVYVVIATDEYGCVNSDTILVDINGYMDVFVPNIFSPNGDGFNDLLVINGPRLYNYTIEIYDRWGKKIFVSNEQKDYWDGSFNGSLLAPQTFVYMLSGETVLGERITKEGNVSIIK